MNKLRVKATPNKKPKRKMVSSATQCSRCYCTEVETQAHYAGQSGVNCYCGHRVNQHAGGFWDATTARYVAYASLP